MINISSKNLLLLSIAVAISTWSVVPKNTALASAQLINKSTDNSMQRSHSPQSAHSTKTLVSQSGMVFPVSRILRQIKGKTQVPIFLPNRLPFSGRLYFNSYAETNGYNVGIGSTPNCDATPCAIGELSAQRGEQPATPDSVVGSTNAVFKNIQLARGIRGIFTNGCGAYCTASIEWQYQEVLYRVSMKNGEERILIQIANSAIEAGPR